MKLGEKLPETTPLLARLRMFQPTHRPELLAGDWIETKHGRARVKGRLGQRHADVMESILRTARHQLNGGRIELLVDPALVRRSISRNGYSGSGLADLMDDLFQAEIEIKSKSGHLHTRGRIIDLWRRSTKTALNPLDGGERQLWLVKLGDIMTDLLDKDNIFYRTHREIPILRTGVAKAIARHCLSHSVQPNGGWKLDTLLESTCGALGCAAVRDKRRDVRSDMGGLLKCGIRLSVEDRVFFV